MLKRVTQNSDRDENWSIEIAICISPIQKYLNAERYMLKTSVNGTTHQRQTATKGAMSSTRKSTATRPTNYTAGRTLSSQPGETKKTSSCAS